MNYFAVIYLKSWVPISKVKDLRAELHLTFVRGEIYFFSLNSIHNLYLFMFKEKI